MQHSGKLRARSSFADKEPPCITSTGRNLWWTRVLTGTRSRQLGQINRFSVYRRDL